MTPTNDTTICRKCNEYKKKLKIETINKHKNRQEKKENCISQKTTQRKNGTMINDNKYTLIINVKFKLNN